MYKFSYNYLPLSCVFHTKSFTFPLDFLKKSPYTLPMITKEQKESLIEIWHKGNCDGIKCSNCIYLSINLRCPTSFDEGDECRKIIMPDMKKYFTEEELFLEMI